MSTLLNKKEEFTSEFSNTEACLKAYEHACNNTLTGSINELRYAGKHHADACRAELHGDIDAAIDSFDRAIRHVMRARYDILEARVCHAMVELSEASDFYRGYEDLAAAIIPDYLDHQKKLRALGKEMECTGELDKEDSKYQEVCESRIAVINSFLEAFHAAQKPLVAAMQKREERNTYHEQEVELLKKSLTQANDATDLLNQTLEKANSTIELLKDSLKQANRATIQSWIAGFVFCILGVLLGLWFGGMGD